MADTPHTSGTSGDADRGHAHGEDQPMARLWMAMSGASAGGHHEEIPGVNPTAAKVGHEADKFDARTIVYVPIVVAVVLVVTYLLVQGAFLFVNGRESRQEVEVATTDPAESARVAKENQTRVKEWNDRSARTRNWTADPVRKATPGDQPLPAVPQPQLEYNRQVDLTRKDANGNVVTDPPFVRSFKPTGTNNSPEIYPESLRVANFQDPWTGTRLLGESAWVKGHEGKLATVNIDDMIHLVVTDDQWKGVLKVAEKKADLHPGTLGKPKISTGGLHGPLPAAGETKKDDHHK